jgi:hypothetical protein
VIETSFNKWAHSIRIPTTIPPEDEHTPISENIARMPLSKSFEVWYNFV